MEKTGHLLPKLWVGQEKEGEFKGEMRLYVGQKTVTYDEVKKYLYLVNGVYFGHKVSWDVVRSLINKTKIYVEVNSVSEVPQDVLGFITIILRIPKIVDSIKIIDEGIITVYDWRKQSSYKNKWDGKILYEGDKADENIPD